MEWHSNGRNANNPRKQLTDNPNYGSTKRDIEQLLSVMESASRSSVTVLSEEDDRKYSESSLDRFPQYTSSLDFSDATIQTQVTVDDRTRLLENLAAILTAGSKLGNVRSLDPDSVVIFWANHKFPSLLMPTELAAQNIQELVSIEDDMWIFVLDNDSLIEVHGGKWLTVVEIPK